MRFNGKLYGVGEGPYPVVSTHTNCKCTRDPIPVRDPGVPGEPILPDVPALHPAVPVIPPSLMLPPVIMVPAYTEDEDDGGNGEEYPAEEHVPGAQLLPGTPPTPLPPPRIDESKTPATRESHDGITTTT